MESDLAEESSQGQEHEHVLVNVSQAAVRIVGELLDQSDHDV